MVPIGHVYSDYKEAVTKVAQVWKAQSEVCNDVKVKEIGRKVLEPISQSAQTILALLEQLDQETRYFDNQRR